MGSPHPRLSTSTYLTLFSVYVVMFLYRYLTMKMKHIRILTLLRFSVGGIKQESNEWKSKSAKKKNLRKQKNSKYYLCDNTFYQNEKIITAIHCVVLEFSSIFFNSNPFGFPIIIRTVRYDNCIRADRQKLRKSVMFENTQLWQFLSLFLEKTRYPNFLNLTRCRRVFFYTWQKFGVVSIQN